MGFLRNRKVALSISAFIIIVTVFLQIRAGRQMIYGSWLWDGGYIWIYNFERREGAGTRGTPGNFESFIWHRNEHNQLVIDRGYETPRGELRFETWTYTVTPNILILESVDDAGRTHTFLRQ